MISRKKLLSDFKTVRKASIDMIKPLNDAEPYIQPMADVSPPAWNLAHTTWFFKKILDWNIKNHGADILPDYLFNSYYEKLGDRNPRTNRGSITNPAMKHILAYRKVVDKKIISLISKVNDSEFNSQQAVWPNSVGKGNLSFQIQTGINHEQQHQELFYSEIKNIRWQNLPEFREAYNKTKLPKSEISRKTKFITIPCGTYTIGSENGWAYDNEYKAHKMHIAEFKIQDRLVTNGDFLKFVEDGGYNNPLYWLSNGWEFVKKEKLNSPLYWYRNKSNAWKIWTLNGDKDLDLNEPVTHVSFYEAHAFAKWSGARLPTEHEWEAAAKHLKIPISDSNLVESKILHPKAPKPGKTQMIGDVWEWTTSHYEPYPGFKEFPEGIGEYNGKFMDNQRVLRGGSCATSKNHIRISYRNFWPANTRFQFSGIRLVIN